MIFNLGTNNVNRKQHILDAHIISQHLLATNYKIMSSISGPLHSPRHQKLQPIINPSIRQISSVTINGDTTEWRGRERARNQLCYP